MVRSRINSGRVATPFGFDGRGKAGPWMLVRLRVVGRVTDHGLGKRARDGAPQVGATPGMGEGRGAVFRAMAVSYPQASGGATFF